MLTKTRNVPGKINKHVTNGRCKEIEGYCSANSVRAGETLKIMVSTNPESNFKLEIFRSGYYGGSGARRQHRYNTQHGAVSLGTPMLVQSSCSV